MGGTMPPARGSVSGGPGGGGGHPGGGGGNNPYSSWHGTPRADHQPRRSTGNVTELNSLPRQQGRQNHHRRSVTCNNDPALVIPLIEYNMASGMPPAGSHLDNGGEMLHNADNERHYSTLDRVDRGDRGGDQRGPQRVGARPKVNVVSDNRRTYDNANHIGGGGHLGNHVDSEAAEAEDYYPDDTDPSQRNRGPGGGGLSGGIQPQPPMTSGRAGGYVKYNSFANY